MHSKENSTVLPGESSNNASHGDVYYIAALPPFRSRACLAALCLEHTGATKCLVNIKRLLRNQLVMMV